MISIGVCLIFEKNIFLNIVTLFIFSNLWVRKKQNKTNKKQNKNKNKTNKQNKTKQNKKQTNKQTNKQKKKKPSAPFLHRQVFMNGPLLYVMKWSPGDKRKKKYIWEVKKALQW